MKAYTVDKHRVGLPDDWPFATIPQHWTVDMLINTEGWFRFIKDVAPGESPQENEHFVRLFDENGKPWKPTVVMLNQGDCGRSIRGVNLDRVSSYGAVSLTLLNTGKEETNTCDDDGEQGMQNFRTSTRHDAIIRCRSFSDGGGSSGCSGEEADRLRELDETSYIR